MNFTNFISGSFSSPNWHFITQGNRILSLSSPPGMHTHEETEARRRLVVRGIPIAVVAYIEIKSFWKIIVGRTPASEEPCFGSKLAIEISLYSNTSLSCSRSSFSNNCGIKYFRAIIFVVKFSRSSPAIFTRKLQLLFSGARLHLILLVTFFFWQ